VAALLDVSGPKFGKPWSRSRSSFANLQKASCY